MAKALGPTIPRWRLGDELAKLRESRGVTFAEAAHEVGCSERKIRKIEAGEVSVSKADLKMLLDMYGVEDRAQLEELQALGRQRGWWSPFARWIASPQQAEFFGVELAAREIWSWDPLVVPGLLQTERYVRAIAVGNLHDDETVEKHVRIRMDRQKLIWDEEPPQATFIIDESVLTRLVGGPDVMREQLDALLHPPKGCKVQVIPLTIGAHPGVAGSLKIFEFDGDVHSPVVYTETPVGSMYLEEGRIEACLRAMGHMAAAAANPAASRRLIRAKMEAVLAE